MPKTKDIIWFRVKLEVNNPIETKEAVRKKVPIYWATIAPLSKFPDACNVNGINRLKRDKISLMQNRRDGQKYNQNYKTSRLVKITLKIFLN